MRILLVVFSAVALLSPAFAVDPLDRDRGETVSESGQEAAAIQRVWLGADGSPLPLKTDAEIMEFLRTAEISETSKIPVGVTEPRKALLEMDGIRAHATFKDVDETEERVRLSDGTYVQQLRDFYKFEYAGYQVALLLGLDNVPPTVIRRHGRNDGSLQMWVENSMTDLERREQGLRPPVQLEWMFQVQTMYLFDNLIGNVDRNQGDIVIDSDWKLWMIDHSRAFQFRFKMRYMDQVLYCERGFWEKLQALNEDQIREAVGDALTGREIDGMLERRDIILAHIQKLIEERGGEDFVIYEKQ